MTDHADLAAAPLARAFLEGEADPVAVTETLLERIAAAEGSAVFLTVTAERARSEAAAARARYRDGRPASPLDGVTVAWKDLFDMKGVVTTAGSALLRHAAPAEQDAPVVAQLAAAGMVSLGKVNLTEFAYSGLGLNPHYGTPANPHDAVTPRVPGGSSSGSAVAVAAGLATTAIGSDTGGSIRVPAAFNGIVGYKASEGRIAKDGVFPLSATLDTVGPLARTVEDLILLDAAMRGTAPTVRRAEIGTLRFVVPDTHVLEDCDDIVVSAFENAVRRLEAAGARVETAHVPELAEAARITTVHGTITAAEAYSVHRERLDSPDVSEIDGRVVARILRGKEMTAFDLVTIIAARAALAASLRDRLGGALLLAPTVPHVAPEIAPLDADPAVFNTVNLRTLKNTMVGNFLNTPGVAMPMASPSPLPVSLMVSADGGADERLLAAAAAMERIVRGD
jgi:aspartyl-tRNA(Asn)/glutamyl-tRNA(Gln) amidotransferase subunit A